METREIVTNQIIQKMQNDMTVQQLKQLKLVLTVVFAKLRMDE